MYSVHGIPKFSQITAKFAVLLLLAAITQILMVSCSHEQMIMMILRLRTIVARLQNPLKSEQSLYQSVALMATLAQMTNV